MAVDPRALDRVLPLAAVSLAYKRAQPSHDPNELLVPAVVAEYLEAIDADERKWYDRSVLWNVVTGALQYGPATVLVAVQSWVLRSAWTSLGDWWGAELAGWHQPDMSKRTAATRVYEPAAQQLFGCDASLLDWTGPDEDWLALWRIRGNRDPEILERAGLGVAELALLEARGE